MIVASISVTGYITIAVLINKVGKKLLIGTPNARETPDTIFFFQHYRAFPVECLRYQFSLPKILPQFYHYHRYF
jgi:hypothetical protein